MKFGLIGGLILLVVSTMSLAQIRYALSNPLTSVTTILGVAVEIGLIAYLAYRFIAGQNSTNGTYSLVGVKGGRSTRRGSNLNNHRKNQRTSF